MRAVYMRNPFQGLSKWMACCIVILELAVCDPRPTYHWEDRHTKAKLLCRQCPPGSYVERHCTEKSETVCAPCPSLHYTGFWNYLERCLYCSVFCHGLEEEVQPCNGTHNRACQCKPGYHADSDFCVEHTKCAPGTGVARPGNPHEDTKCAPCPEGTFSSTSSSDACQPHQNCSERGQKVNVPGNQFHDTFCTACRQNKSVAIVNGTDESSAIDGCEDAVLDYVPFQIRVPRRLQRLKRLLSNSPPSSNCPKGSLEHLQMDLHSFLIQLKSSEGAKGVLEKVMEALERMKLEHILSKITKHFLSL